MRILGVAGLTQLWFLLVVAQPAQVAALSTKSL